MNGAQAGLIRRGSVARPFMAGNGECANIMWIDLAKIQTGDPSWEALVPPRIVQIITQDKLFGYKPRRER